MADFPIFIVGYLHSGTTLLRNIFQDHPDIFTGEGETRFFDYLPMIRRNFPDLQEEQSLHNYLLYLAQLIRTNFGKVHIEQNSEGVASFSALGFSERDCETLFATARGMRDHAQLFGLVSDQLCRIHGKRRWLEKTPTHLFHINTILAAVPNAHFIAITRDPRDVLASKRSRQQQEWIEQGNAARRSVKQIQAGFDPLWDTLAWKAAVNAVVSAESVDPERVMNIRYEDLVSDPETTVRRICQFLQLEYQETMLDVAWTNSTTQSQGQRGIGTESIGKWRRHLTPAMVALCQFVARKEMKKFHYAPVAVGVFAQVKAPLLLGRSFYEFFERLWRRWRVGGLSFVRNVLVNYWLRFINIKQNRVASKF
ncbi:MAG TPA: sulfotransferase [Caldilineaceae bacterium]|nr:sulfotransferase [Caldilineaceae bacterium]